MIARSGTSATASDDTADTTPDVARGALLRWLLSYGTFSVPQAAGPIAFALLAIPLTGDPKSGAAIVLTMTIAQVVGAVPVARLGRSRLHQRDSRRNCRVVAGYRLVSFRRDL